MKKGSSAGILVNPTHVILVWNIKFITKARELLATVPHDFSGWEDAFEDWRKRRELPRRVRDWVYSKLMEPGQKMVKGDKYGFGCGHIEERDEFLAIARNDPENYPHYALMREFKEEIGTKIAKEVNGRVEILFEHVGTQYEKDHESGAMTYPTNFYWVKEAYGELNKEGFEGETEAPELVRITTLDPRNFYPKHGYALKALLSRLVWEYGMKEYADALNYVSKVFRGAEEKYANDFLEASIRTPELQLSNAEIWANYIESRPDIVQAK